MGYIFTNAWKIAKLYAQEKIEEAKKLGRPAIDDPRWIKDEDSICEKSYLLAWVKMEDVIILAIYVNSLRTHCWYDLNEPSPIAIDYFIPVE